MSGLITIVAQNTPEFLKEQAFIEGRHMNSDEKSSMIVRDIIGKVRKNGDSELIKLTKKFDKADFSKSGFRVEQDVMQKARKQISKELLKDLKFAAARIKKFHQKQVEKSWQFQEEGVLLGQIIRPVERAGVYAPGGKAVYPSSVLMNAIPAKVAGVQKIVLCTPAKGGELNPVILAAAAVAGVDEVYALGGAQAIAAMAFGTETVPRVDVITGPGNIFVAEAKRQLFGMVNIDMIAGPSEILIIADSKAKPALIAADLISQAEHDEMAYPILITTSAGLAKKVRKELEKQSVLLDRTTMIQKSLRNNCRAFITKNIADAADLANRFASEHLEIMTEKPKSLLKKITHAGAIFLGENTPEAVGDYVAGPNHVLPTGGSARFFSPLGVYNFMKRTSLISFSKKSLKQVSASVIRIAESEGLSGHAEAVRKRLE